jgi:hypothetical protein
VAQIFKEWTNKLPTYFAVAVAVLAVCGMAFVWYYFSPWYTDVGYRPVQPVAFSHKLHADDLGLDCRYCHHQVERSPRANVPPTQTCMNCHKMILPESEKLLMVRESWSDVRPLSWVRVHRLPDYAYFDHSAHLAAGVGCVSCHGNVARMQKVTQKQPLSMGWCLECHRDPAGSLRPREELTSMIWQTPSDHAQWAEKMIKQKAINPPVDCSGCHR